VSDEVARLVAAINDHPDAAHGDYTPAVHALVRIGVEALPALLPLLKSADAFTRMRAQRVLEGVTRAWVRARTPSPRLSQRPGSVWQALWRDNGNYDWHADAEMNAASIARWKAWLTTALALPKAL